MSSFANPDGAFLNETGGQPATVVEPASGATVVMGWSQRDLYIANAALLGSLTVRLPKKVGDGQRVTVACQSGITALAVQDGFGNPLLSVPASLAAGSALILRYINSTVGWTLLVGASATTAKQYIIASGTPASDPNIAVGVYADITNTGPAQGYGIRVVYESAAAGTGFDIADSVLGVWSAATVAGQQQQTQWMVGITPASVSVGWGQAVTELNIVNRGADQGWAASRSARSNWTIGMQIVPESKNFTFGGNTYNVLAGYVLGHSQGTNQAGLNVKSYNGLLIENDSVAPSGRGVYAAGDTSGVSAQYPYAPFQFADTWQHGIVVSGASVVDNTAMLMDPVHTLSWTSGTASASISGNGSGSNVGLTLATAGTGNIIIPTLPTSAAGLPHGALWNNSGVLSVAP